MEEELIKSIDELSKLKAFKSRASVSDDLKKIRERVCSKEFRISVVGEFSSGKSTFINALIGKDILTHATNETTAAITYIYNVPRGDARIGKCEIRYHNGTTKAVGISELVNYTTVQKGDHVAEKIHSVSVYEPFLDVDYPLVIVDTPGLNGIADKHREITIEQVKQSHACIYLFQLKGISESDVDFISVLKNYQNRFIFVQNFIDDIHTTEGETVADKLDDDRKNIDNNLGKSSAEFSYELCGISALKALASKDHNIKKLYSNSIAEIAPEERDALWNESRFENFLNIIKRIMDSVEYRKTVIASAVQALYSLINSILPGMLEKQTENDELLKSDKRSEMLARMEQMLKRMEDNREPQKTKLENFLISRNRENCKGLKEYAENGLRDIYNEVCKDIDNRIKDYDDMENFEVRNKGKTIPSFFSDKVSARINSNLIPDINQRLSEELSHLYDEGAQRVMEYTEMVNSSFSGNKIAIDGGKENISVDETNWRADITKAEIEIGQREQELAATNRRIEQNNKQLLEQRQQLYSAQYGLSRAEREGKLEIEHLGAKPEAVSITVEKTREVDRKGPFRKLVQKIAGPKVETYYVDEYDYTDQENWRKKVSECQSRMDNNTRKYRRDIETIQKQIADLERQVEADKMRSAQNADIIRGKKERIKRERENYETMEKRYKQEFYCTQIKSLKKSINDKLFDTDSDSCVLVKLKDYIDRTSKSHLAIITQKVLAFHDQSLNDRIAALKEKINAGSEQLQEIYKADMSEIAVISRIQKQIAWRIK